MKLHPNAKTTPLMRQLVVTRVRHLGWPQRRAASALGSACGQSPNRSLAIARRLVCSWDSTPRARTEYRGRPRSPRSLRSSRYGGRRRRAGRSAAAAGATVNRDTGARSSRAESAGPAGPPPVIQRYEWPHAGDLLHVDIKPLGRIRAVGHRFLGPSVHTQTRGSGWEYAHVAVDDATRLAYVEVRRSQGQPACTVFLRHAVRWFARRGIRVRRILTDNGSAYRSHRFARLCRRWSLRHKFTRPYTPRTNGKAERFIQTLLRQWAYRRPYRNSAARTAALPAYLHFYNHRRPHASLGRRSPWTRFHEAA